MDFFEFDKAYSRMILGFTLDDIVGDISKIDEMEVVKEIVSYNKYLLSLNDYKDLSRISDFQKEWLSNKNHIKSKLILLVIDFLKEINIKLNKHKVLRLLAQVDSYNRPYIFLALDGVMEKEEWLSCLFKMWRSFDGCSLYTSEFKEKLKFMDFEKLMQTYGKDDLYLEWLDLPEKVCLYRGAFESDKFGLSWTTNIEVAHKFANSYISIKNKGGMYYRAMSVMTDQDMEKLKKRFKDKVSIYMLVANKKDCLMINNPNEKEVIVVNAEEYKLMDILS